MELRKRRTVCIERFKYEVHVDVSLEGNEQGIATFHDGISLLKYSP